ncbi:MOP flippase family protein [Pedobacter sp. B4-66]|uniref:MOP flippase family protein n=1 Tax=Pedobacter sp. B4-66 TaxID=2817280 RepID=UPI001BDA0697|nr:MOP flippase family protein [Pedobacter sp. B4-66]
MSSIKKVIIGGFFWSIVNQLSITLIGLVITGVLARLISPADFGLLAMVTLAIGFLNVLKDFGFGAALIQKKEVSDDEYSTVFWINLIIGCFLTLIVFFSAPFIASFFKESKLENVTKILSFTFIINSIGIVWNNKLLKDVAFKQIFYRSIISTIISGVCAIILAFYKYGILALIAQTYIALILNTYLNYLHVKWVPNRSIKKVYIKDLIKFGLPLLADQSINYWVRNIDNLLVGRTLGKDTLAYYNKAYSLMLLPVRQLTGTLAKVLFPSFSLIQDNKEQIANIYLKISRIIAFVAFPVMVCLSMLSEPVILIVYGENWRPVIPIFQVLSILGMLQALGTLSGNIYLSLGQTKKMFKIGLLSRGLMIFGIVFGLHLGGLMGMVYGYCIGSACAFFPELHVMGRLINLNLKTIVFNFAPYLLLVSICFLVIKFTFAKIQLNFILGFSIQLTVFAILYLLLNVLFKTKAYKDILSMLTSIKLKN